MSEAALIEGSTILIVDDTPVGLGPVVEALESTGCKVLVAEDGEEALHRAHFARPDLILLDVMMPGMHGFDVCRRLKESAATSDIPVIFTTALGEIADKITGFAVGAVDYITKPLHIEETVARVTTHLRLRAMQRRLEAQNDELKRYREQLEQRVAERTKKLDESNRRLRQEIRERQRMGIALSASERQFRTLAENSPDIIARYDRELRRIYVSPAFERLGGTSAQNLIGKTIDEVPTTTPAVAELYQQHLRAVLASGQARELDIDWHTRDDQVLSLAVRAAPEFGDDGQVASVLTIARDISERKRIEGALRESERRYRDIFNHVSDGMCMVEVTGDGRFLGLEYNPAMARLLGIAPERVLGQAIDAPELGEMACMLGERLRRCAESGTAIHEDAEIDLPAGRRYYKLSFVPLRAPGGRIYRIVAICRDATAQWHRQMMEHVRLQMLEELAAGAPLTGVLGLAVACVEAIYPDLLGSIMLLDENGCLRSCPTSSLPEAYLAAVDGVPAGDGVGSCGTAAWRNDTVVVEDVRTHPYWASYKHLAVEAGFLSCWSEPVRDSNGKVVATLAMYRREPGAPSREEMEIVREAGFLVTFALERKKNEAMLYRREQEFRMLAENSPDVVARMDTAGRYIYCNAQFEKVVGLPKEKIIGKRPLELRENEAIRILQAKIDEVLATGREAEMIHVLDVSHDHRKIYDHVRFAPEFDEAGKVASVLVIGRDVSALKETERQLRTLVENIPDLVMRLDTAARYLYVSPAVSKTVGLPPEHFLGKPVAEVTFTGDLVSDLQMQEAVLMSAREGVPSMLTMTVPHRSGDRVFDILYVPERDEFGRVASVLGVARDITSLQAAHRELQRKEALLRSLIDSIPDLIFFKDTESVYLGFNKAFAEYCGYSEADMEGKTDYDFAPREVADFYRYNDREMLAGGKARHNDEWVEYPDGRRLLFDTLKTPLYDANGKVVGIIGISRDITERKRLQDEIAMREREVRALVENSPDAVVRYDRQCRRIFVNRTFEIISDVRREDVLGTTPLEFWRLSMPAERYMALLRRIMETGTEEELHYDMTVAGSQHFLNMRLVPEYDASGEVASVLAISRDITDLKRAETLLRKSELEFRTLAENSPDMIVRYDPDCRRVYINPAYERYTGIPLEDAWNKTPDDVWRPLMSREEYKARLQRILESGEPDSILLEWYLPDGSLTSHQMHAVAEYDEQGKPVGTLVIGHNISELKAAERRLEESRAALRALTARREEAREDERKRIAREIHDELGQLLSVLRLNVTTLDFRFGNDNPDLRDKTRNMVGTVDRAIAMVRSLATRLRPAVLTAGMVPAIEWLAQEFSANAGINCKLHVEGDEIALDEDKSMVVFRIVQESLTNVLRHSGADSIEIRLRCDEEAYEVTVCDNGKGFDPAKVGRKNSLGLVGMRERALMLGGELEIVSHPGKGATLKLRVPLDEESGLA